MTALPAKNVLDGSAAPLTSAMKTAMGQLRDFIAETVGSVGGAVTIAKTAVTSPVAADGNVFSGNYTPTITPITNVAAYTAFSCTYIRLGDVVTVSGIFNVDPTATGAFALEMSLPISTAFTNQYQAGGTFSEASAGISWGGIRSKASTGIISIGGQSPASTANQTCSFSVTYRVI